MAGGGGGDGGRRGSDRCVALVSSGHRRLRPGLLQDVANLPDSPEPLSRSSRDCHSLATTLPPPSWVECRVPVARPPSNCQPTATRLERATDLAGSPPFVGGALPSPISPLLNLFHQTRNSCLPSCRGKRRIL